MPGVPPDDTASDVAGPEGSGTDPGLAAAPPPPPGAGVPAPGAGYAWPLQPPPAVLTPFRAPTHAYGPGHRGVDLAGRAGQPVLAARAGTVAFAGPVAGHGVVSVQHDDGLVSELSLAVVGRTGNAVYVDYSFGSAGGDAQVRDETARLVAGSAQPVQALCAFAVEPCAG